jgi:hypothetical protein
VPWMITLASSARGRSDDGKHSNGRRLLVPGFLPGRAVIEPGAVAVGRAAGRYVIGFPRFGLSNAARAQLVIRG